MTSRAVTTSSGVSVTVSTRRPLVHQRQISFLALPPLLIPSNPPQSQPQSQQQHNYSHSSYPPREPTPPIASSSTTNTTALTSSILRPPHRPTGSSLIAHLQQHQLQQQAQKRLISTTQPNMSSAEEVPEIITRTRAAASGTPGEQVEPRQTLPSEDMERIQPTVFNYPPIDKS
jgi:hypothetical protein